MYTDADERLEQYSNGSEPVLAMHMWNDWNTQSLLWQQLHSHTNSSFEYMVVRSEDMVNPTTKLATLQRMAAFVESSISSQDLCDIANRNAVDLGQSKSWNLDNNTNEEEENIQSEPAEHVKQRYGKWRHLLENKPELSSMLHQQGAKGLAVFGYEPRSTMLTLGSSVLERGIDTLNCET